MVANAEKFVPLVTAHAVESDQLPGSRRISGDSNYRNYTDVDALKGAGLEIAIVACVLLCHPSILICMICSHPSYVARALANDRGFRSMQSQTTEYSKGCIFDILPTPEDFRA